MSILLLCQCLMFVVSLPYCGAKVPSLNVGSLPQSAVAAIPSLGLSSNFTLPPSPAARRLQNTSNVELPADYFIPDTNPLIILTINPALHVSIDSYVLTYAIMRGLDSLVHDVIQSRGDSPIPPLGLLFSWDNVAVEVKSHLPGTLDLTYGMTAATLRGIYEIATLYGAYGADIGVYVGREDAAHYRGIVAVFLTAGSSETA